jgi:lipopolysaccharide transport system ATP-binding protein
MVSDTPIISLQSVGMCYRLKKGFIRGQKSDFWAIQDVSLDIYKGETLGIVGRNGAGKSSLLRVIAGIIRPDRGEIFRFEKVRTLLLSLGVGFEAPLSGRENAILGGLLLGLRREEIYGRLESIKEFSELGDFFEEPLYTYSSGMVTRLGFSVAMEADPEVILIDEVMSVGDASFQQKSEEALKQRLKSNRTALLVSHSSVQIKKMCTRAIWIDHGKVLGEGDPIKVADDYEASLHLKVN